MPNVIFSLGATAAESAATEGDEKIHGDAAKAAELVKNWRRGRLILWFRNSPDCLTVIFDVD